MRMMNFLRLIKMQHILHFRWIVNQMNPYIVVTKRKLLSFFLIIPFAIGMIIYFFLKGLFYLMLSNDFQPTKEQVEVTLSFLYLALFWRLLTHSYREVFLRAFYSNDYKFLTIHNNDMISIRLAKLVDAFFLNIIFFTLPFFVGASLAFNHVFIGYHIHIMYYILDTFLVIGLALITRMLIMSLSGLLKQQKSSKARSWFVSLPFYFVRLGITALVGYFSFYIIYNSSAMKTIIKKFQSFEWFTGLITSLYFPTNWVLQGLYIPFIILLLFGIYVLLWIHKKFKGAILGTDSIQRGNFTIPNLLFKKTNSKLGNLFYKDLLLLVRNRELVLPQLRLFLTLAALFLGISLAVSELGWFRIDAVSFSTIVVFQLLVTAFAGNMVTRVTSIDAEGKMIKVLLIHLKNPFKLFQAKFILHFLFLLLINFMVSLIFTIAIKANVKVITFGFVSLLLISIVSSLSFLVANVIFPRFDWEDESRIGTSDKANILESIILRIYELINITVFGTSGAFLYAHRLNEQTFFQYSIGCILLTSLSWSVILLIVMRYPWWKGWKI
ncbi:hypothetical protein [Geobacillus icigianus]|nr:hypothetical protein [Geobacillus icigianus]